MRLSTACAATALAAVVSAQANYTVKCVDGLHVIVTRASTEPPGFGILVSVKDRILARVPNSDAQWTPYPATLDNYGTSEPAGVGNLTHYLTQYVDQCPCSKVALLGYSQGAHVIGDVLIGPSYPTFPSFGFNSGIAQKYVDAVQSVVMMGDPANIVGAPVDVGNATSNGLFVRNNTANWQSKGLVGKVQSYCDANDTYCASGGASAQSLFIHLSYVTEYGAQAVDFVVNRASNSTKGSCSSGSGSNSTTSTNGTTTTTGGSNSTSTSPGSTTTTKSSSPTPTTTTTPTPTNNGIKTGVSTVLLLAALAAVL